MYQKHTAVDRNEVTSLRLYYRPTCPYCRRVLGGIKKLNLNVDLRNISKSNSDLRDLVKQGGKQQVPCLVIESQNGKTKWMYESGDILRFLQEYASTTLGQ